MPKPSAQIENIGFDESHTLWAIAGYRLYSWQGTEFRESIAPEFQSGIRLTSLHRGPDGSLYVIGRRGSSSYSEIYRLVNGRAVYIADVLRPLYSSLPNFYVTKDGRFLNWTENQVQIYADNQWHPLSMGPDSSSFTILDLGHTLCLYRLDTLYTIDKSCTVQSKIIRPNVYMGGGRGTLWGSDKAMFMHNADGRVVNAYDLPSGEPVPVDDINAFLKSYLRGTNLYPTNLCSGPDGSVWMLAYSRQSPNPSHLVRISSDGSVEPINQTVGLPWGDFPIDFVGLTLLASDGSAWIGLPNTGVIHYKDGQISQNDFRQGNGPRNCARLWEGPTGDIYAASDQGLYVYRDGQPPEDNLCNEWPPVREALDVVWRYSPPEYRLLENAWLIDDLLACSSECYWETSVRVLDAHTGTERFVTELPHDSWIRVWVTRGHAADTLLITVPNHLETVDVHTGKTIRSVVFDHDYRVEPALIGDDYVVAKGARGEELVRINPQGQTIWSLKMPDSLVTHPSQHRSLLLVQPTSSGTKAVDLDSGRILWFDYEGADGYGTSIAANGEYSVEALCYTSLTAVEGWVIAREPGTGRKLWHYRRPRNSIVHAPIIDATREQVYAAFQGGEIVCLNVKSGNVLWETILPDRVHLRPLRYTTMKAYWPPMAIADGLLIIIDRSDLIYILDTDTGHVKARLDLAGQFLGNGIRTGSAGLGAAPSIVGNTLIVTTKEAVTAYSLAGMAASPQTNGLHQPANGIRETKQHTKKGNTQ